MDGDDLAPRPTVGGVRRVSGVVGRQPFGKVRRQPRVEPLRSRLTPKHIDDVPCRRHDGGQVQAPGRAQSHGNSPNESRRGDRIAVPAGRLTETRLGWRSQPKLAEGERRLVSELEPDGSVAARRRLPLVGRLSGSMAQALSARAAGRSAGVGTRRALAGSVTTATVLPVMSKNSTE